MPDILDTSKILAEEFKLIHGPGKWTSATTGGESLNDYYKSVRELKRASGDPESQAALCFSGGGIRSAAFNLGVLQGLARKKLLGEFHYLSTVSGGGYIGCWLTAWVHRKAAAGSTDPLADVEKQLGPREPDQEKEPEPFQSLRANQKFLTPSAGLASPDTWAAIAIIVRNLVLNLLVFVPILAAILLVPRLLQQFLAGWVDQTVPPSNVPSSLEWVLNMVRAALSRVSPWSGQAAPWLAAPTQWQSWIDSAAALFTLYGLSVSMANRPIEGEESIKQSTFVKHVLSPVVLGALLLLIAALSWDQAGSVKWAAGLDWVALSAIVYVVVRLGASLYLRIKLRKLPRRGARELCLEVLALAVSGALFGLLAWSGNLLRIGSPGRTGLSLDMALAFGVPWLLVSFLTSQVLYVGLTSRAAFGERDREWMARASGFYGATAILWIIYFSIVLYGPSALKYTTTFLFTTLGSGTLSLAGARSSLTKSSKASVAMSERLPFTKVTALLSAVALACLSVLIVQATTMLLAPLFAGDALGGQISLPFAGPLALASVALAHHGAWVSLAAIVGLMLFSRVVSSFVNINNFSLHALYRNRLVRAFLGASNDKAHRNPFDGYAGTDNIAMGDLWRDKTGKPTRRGLFPVVNLTLNLLDGRNPAWRDRKAAPFVSTPLHTGGDLVRYRDSRLYGSADPAAVAAARHATAAKPVPAGRPCTGISLGTAMAISGAAVSPNWGYHSSALTSFLMMLFNVRLGWWLGNPNAEHTWFRSCPKSSWSLFYKEALGRTTDDKDYVYLSDGGHFDNLGLYEMVRRRCRLIVVSDASSDPDCSLEDLGRTLRNIYVDLGVDIKFEPISLRKRGPDLGSNGVYCAIGTIYYPEERGLKIKPVDARIIYIKPGLYSDAPADVRAYAASNARFPHDTTANQWFNESQFESYRALGSHVIEQSCQTNSNPQLSATEFVVAVDQYLKAFKADPSYAVRLVS